MNAVELRGALTKLGKFIAMSLVFTLIHFHHDEVSFRHSAKLCSLLGGRKEDKVYSGSI